MICAHIPAELQCRCAAHQCGFGDPKLLKCGQPFLARERVDAGLRLKPFDDQFGNALADPIQRAIAGCILEWENQNGAGVRARLAGAKQRESHIYEDAPHIAIILELRMRIAIDIRKINEFGVGT